MKLGLLLVLTLGFQPLGAAEWWHDPARGCGDVAAWKVSKRISDLPGCDGELPKGAPPGEIAMHDAKLKLHEAERLLDRKQADGVEGLMAEAVAIMNAAPNEPRTNWARKFYAEAQEMLGKRLAELQPKSPG